MPLSKALRPSGALIIVALAIASCNKDFHGVGANLLEEQAFNTQSARVPVYAYQDATEKVQADGLPLAQLGEIHHPVFGKAQAAIVSQLQLTSNAVFGNFSQAREDALDEDNIQVIQENEQVIAAYLEIPFFNNLKDSDSDGVIDAFDSDPEDPQSDTDGDGLSDLIETQSGYNPLDPDSDGDGILDPDDEDSEFDQENKVYQIDSLYGNRAASFDIKVYELTYYLSRLDPYNNFETPLAYFSNRDYVEEGFTGALLHHSNYTLNFDELRFNYQEDDPETTDVDETTQVETRLSPRIRLPLDTRFFQESFVRMEGQPELDSQDQFNEHLRGLIIQTENFSDDLYMLLDIGQAEIKITYNYDSYNLNDTADDTNDDTIDRLEKTYTMPLGGVQINTLKNTFADAAIAQQIEQSNAGIPADKIYIQGAQKHARIQLFDPENDPLEEELFRVRDQKWLINEANLVFNIDPAYDPVTGGSLPDRLYLYNYKTGMAINDYVKDQSLNSDVKNGDKYIYGGLLEYDDNGRPKSYKFRITDHVNNIVRRDSSNVTLGVVLGANTDFIAPKTATLDALRGDIKYPTTGILNPFGVVLIGSHPEAAQIDKKLWLEIFYTEY
ncbi:MAG: DUF4270 family protein [Flavobacteriaceae bacterium]